MNLHTHQKQEDKSLSKTNTFFKAKKGDKSTFQFIDDRPEAFLQRKVQAIANNSAQAKRVTQLQLQAQAYTHTADMQIISEKGNYFAQHSKHNPLPVYQQVAAQNVIQLVYLWDRSQEGQPHWSSGEVPDNFLPSGKHNDGEHGEDELYERLGTTDLFYGINYEDHKEFQPFLEALGEIGKKNGYNIETQDGIALAVKKYEEDGNAPMLDVELYKAIFGGSSGWDKYSAFLPNGKKAAWGTQVYELNPGLRWVNDVTGRACQIAIIEALANNGSVRFLMDGMSNIHGILQSTHYQDKVTSKELIFANDIIGKSITLPDGKVIRPLDGVNVFFYLNRQLVTSELIHLINNDSIQTLSRRLSEKIAEEEEWNEFDEEVQNDILELKEALQGLFSIPQILELLSLS